MKFFNRFIPSLASLLIFIFLELLLKAPKQIYWLAPLCLVIIVLSIWHLTGRNFFTQKFWQFIITPLLLLASGILFLVFLEGYWLKQFYLLGLATLIWLFLTVVFFRFYTPLKYQIHSLENISSHLNLITVFLVTSSFFSLIIFLAIPFWVLLISFCLVFILLNYQLVWSSGVNLSRGWLYLGVITLVSAEIFWATSFLPVSIYVSSLIITLCYYLLAGLTRNWFLEIWEGKVIRRYLLISLVSLIVILATAKWF